MPECLVKLRAFRPAIQLATPLFGIASIQSRPNIKQSETDLGPPRGGHVKLTHARTQDAARLCRREGDATRTCQAAGQPIVVVLRGMRPPSARFTPPGRSVLFAVRRSQAGPAINAPDRPSRSQIYQYTACTDLPAWYNSVRKPLLFYSV